MFGADADLLFLLGTDFGANLYSQSVDECVYPERTDIAGAKVRSIKRIHLITFKWINIFPSVEFLKWTQLQNEELLKIHLHRRYAYLTNSTYLVIANERYTSKCNQVVGNTELVKIIFHVRNIKSHIVE